MSNHLQIFTPTPIESTMLEGFVVNYDVVGGLDANRRGPYHFRVETSRHVVLDLSTLRLNGKFKVTKRDGTNIGADDVANKYRPSVINMAPNSLFESIHVEINDRLINTVTTPANHVKSYIETILSYSNDAAKTHLKASRFEMDTAGKFDKVTGNLGAVERGKWIAESRPVDFSIPVHVDLCSTDRFLPPGLNMKFTFTRSRDQFVLLVEETVKPGDTAVDHIIQITDLRLAVKKIRVLPEVGEQMYKNIINNPTQRPQYPFTKTDLVRRDMAMGISHYSTNLLFWGKKLPRSVIVAMVDTDAYNGDQSKNPYNFQHYDLSEAYLTVNDMAVPSEHYHMNMSGDNQAIMTVYRNLFDHTGVVNNPQSNLITPDLFTEGCFFLAWDLTPDNCNSFHEHLPVDGKMELVLRFAKSLPRNVTLLAFVALHDKLLFDRTFKPILASELQNINPGTLKTM